MKCAIMQPTYLPWMGYFSLIDEVEKFIFLDNVQLEKSSWQTRNKIKTHSGELIISIDRKKNKNADSLSLIKDTEINDQQGWRIKHLKTIKNSYTKALYFDQVFPFVESIINSDFKIISELNINVITLISKNIGLKTEFIKASSIDVNSNNKIERLIKICNFVSCDTYISPYGSLEYINENMGHEIFKQNKIDILYQNFIHPLYNQLYGDFIPYLSIIDLVFNYGFENSLQIIRAGKHNPIEPKKL